MHVERTGTIFLTKMPEHCWQIIAGVVLLAMGVGGAILNELPMPNKKTIWRYLEGVPNKKRRSERRRGALISLVATIVTGIVPLGYNVMAAHPCGAWWWWTAALGFAAYSFWSLTLITRLKRMITICIATIVFLFVARWSIYSETELDTFFVNPGIFLVRGNGDWDLIITAELTKKPIFHADMTLRDEMTARAIRNGKVAPQQINAMIGGGIVRKTYDEIDPGPGFVPDQIQWRPIDVNNQEYSVATRYRIGDKVLFSMEEIRIVNVGEKFSSQNIQAKTNWQFSVTITNQSGEILMHCVGPQFPKDSRWSPGEPCHPTKYEMLPKSLCFRCLGRGFEL
jgi:hypothetical protein